MSYNIGDKVSLRVALPYLKTSDPMPMLRPSDLVTMDEHGIIIGIRGTDILEVKFRRGTFLIPLTHLAIANNHD